MPASRPVSEYIFSDDALGPQIVTCGVDATCALYLVGTWGAVRSIRCGKTQNEAKGESRGSNSNWILEPYGGKRPLLTSLRMQVKTDPIDLSKYLLILGEYQN